MIKLLPEAVNLRMRSIYLSKCGFWVLLLLALNTTVSAQKHSFNRKQRLVLEASKHKDLDERLAALPAGAGAKSKLVLLYDELLEAERASSAQSVKIQFKNLKVEESANLKGYTLDSLILPEWISFDLLIEEGRGSLGLYPSGRILFSSLQNGGIDLVVDSALLQRGGLNLSIQNQELTWTEEGNADLREQLALVQNLEKYQVQVRKYKKDIEAAQLLNPNRYDNNVTLLQDAEAFVEKLQEERLAQSLKLKADAVLLQELKQLALLASTKRSQLDSASAQSQKLYVAEANKALEEGKPKLAELESRHSLLERPGYVPALVSLGESLYEQGEYAAAYDKLLRAADYLEKSDPLMPHIQDVLRLVLAGIVEEASEAIKYKKHKDALELLVKATQLCSVRKLAPCSEEYIATRGAANFMLYDEVFKQARELLDAGDLKAAYSLAEDALQLRDAYPGNIPKDDSLDNLMSIIMTRRYDQHLQNVESYLTYSSAGNALPDLIEARQIELNHEVRRSTRIPHLMEAVAKPYLHELLHGALLLPQKHPAARNVMLAADTLLYFFRLSEDEQTVALVHQLHDYIVGEKCKENRTAYTNGLVGARILASEGRYSLALDTLYTAGRAAADEPLCGIRNNQYLSTLDSIGVAGRYQKKWNLVDTFRKHSQNLQALDAYEELSQLWNDSLAEKHYKLDHPDTLSFITSLEDGAFALQASQRYLGRSKYLLSLDLLKYALNQGVSVRESQDHQEKLGGALAGYDSRQSSADPKSRIDQLTRDVRELRYLKKSYLNSRKRFSN